MEESWWVFFQTRKLVKRTYIEVMHGLNVGCNVSMSEKAMLGEVNEGSTETWRERKNKSERGL